MRNNISASSSKLDKKSGYSHLYQLDYVRYEDYRGSRVWVNSFYSYLRSGTKIYRDGPYYCYSGGAHHYRKIHSMLKVKIMMLVANHHASNMVRIITKFALNKLYRVLRSLKNAKCWMAVMCSAIALKLKLRKPTLMERIFRESK